MLSFFDGEAVVRTGWPGQCAPVSPVYSRGDIDYGEEVVNHKKPRRIYLPWLLSSVGARGFEFSANGLYVFVVAFCVLQLSARCLHLRSIFPLNVLALLHGGTLGYGVIVVGFSQDYSISWMWSVLRLCRLE